MTLRHFDILPTDNPRKGFEKPSMATIWGELQARAQLRGRSRPVNDTWIAACCLVDGLSLATFNTKDFADFAEHDGLRLIDIGPARLQ